MLFQFRQIIRRSPRRIRIKRFRTVPRTDRSLGPITQFILIQIIHIAVKCVCLGRRFQTAAVCQFTGQNPCLDGRVQLLDPADRIRVKRRIDNIIRQTFFSSQCQNFFFHSFIGYVAVFQLDINEQPTLTANGCQQIKHFRHGRDLFSPSLRPCNTQCFQLFQRKILDHTTTVGGAVYPLIMDHHQFSVRGQLNIQFNPCNIIAAGFFKSQQCILWITGTTPAMRPNAYHN